MCKTLGPEFLPYLGVLMPPLLRTAKLEAEVRVWGADDPGLEEEEDDEDVEHVPLGDKVGMTNGPEGYVPECANVLGGCHSFRSSELVVLHLHSRCCRLQRLGPPPAVVATFCWHCCMQWLPSPTV